MWWGSLCLSEGSCKVVLLEHFNIPVPFEMLANQLVPLAAGQGHPLPGEALCALFSACFGSLFLGLLLLSQVKSKHEFFSEIQPLTASGSASGETGACLSGACGRPQFCTEMWSQVGTGEPAWAILVRESSLQAGRWLGLSEYFRKLRFLC